MSTRTYCDRCGKDATGQNIHMDIVNESMIQTCATASVEELDICYECHDDFIKFMEQKKKHNMKVTMTDIDGDTATLEY